MVDLSHDVGFRLEAENRVRISVGIKNRVGTTSSSRTYLIVPIVYGQFERNIVEFKNRVTLVKKTKHW